MTKSKAVVVTKKTLTLEAIEPATDEQGPIEKVNGNLFTDPFELLTFVPSTDGKSGSWDIPRPMLDAYTRACEDLARYQAGIIAYLRSSGQHVPWALQNEKERAEFSDVAMAELPVPEPVKQDATR